MGTATADPPVSKARRKHPDLIFEWVDHKGHRWRLLLFLSLSLALHFACFYAFKVVYPPTVRQRAETTKVTFLDPRDAGVRDVISRIEDRAVFIDGSLRLPVPGASLEDDKNNEVVPVPGFASHEANLRTPPEIDFIPELPRIFPFDDVSLPSQSRLLPETEPGVRPSPFTGEYVYRPSLQSSGGIAGREIVARPDWSKSQEALALATGSATDNSIQFLIEVDEFGDITSCLPWKGVEAAFDAAMAREVETKLKFAPTTRMTRGWLKMRW
ncbi:MAG: hypothetical protein ACI9UA_005714 [Pseudoalteromonas tetraodonis]|jgi:hypothetical protein